MFLSRTIKLGAIAMNFCNCCYTSKAEIEAKDKEIARLRAALEYIKGDLSNRECTCYEEKCVNFFLPCPYHAAKDALEATEHPLSAPSPSES